MLQGVLAWRQAPEAQRRSRLHLTGRIGESCIRGMWGRALLLGRRGAVVGRCRVRGSLSTPGRMVGLSVMPQQRARTAQSSETQGICGCTCTTLAPVAWQRYAPRWWEQHPHVASPSRLFFVGATPARRWPLRAACSLPHVQVEMEHGPSEATRDL